jgi:hypothetical protein
MPNYLLLLHNDPTDWKKMSPEEMQKAIQKFISWRQKLDSRKILVSSAKLRDDGGKIIRGKDGERVTDGPYSETREVLGGYFAITASNYASAVELSRECPGLEYGGTIELREVEPVPSN